VGSSSWVAKSSSAAAAAAAAAKKKNPAPAAPMVVDVLATQTKKRSADPLLDTRKQKFGKQRIGLQHDGIQKKAKEVAAKTARFAKAEAAIKAAARKKEKADREVSWYMWEKSMPDSVKNSRLSTKEERSVEAYPVDSYVGCTHADSAANLDRWHGDPTVQQEFRALGFGNDRTEAHFAHVVGEKMVRRHSLERGAGSAAAAAAAADEDTDTDTDSGSDLDDLELGAGSTAPRDEIELSSDDSSSGSDLE